MEAWFPAANGELLSGAACMFTNTPDTHFILDKHPAHEQVGLQDVNGSAFLAANKFLPLIPDKTCKIDTVRYRSSLSLWKFRLKNKLNLYIYLSGIVQRVPSCQAPHVACIEACNAWQVLLCSACSGHGYKFCSVIGEIMADLAIGGTTSYDIELHRIAASRPGHRELLDRFQSSQANGQS